MKLTFILMLAAIFTVHANGLSQNITLVAKQQSLEDIFRLVEQKTSYVFFYKKDVLQGTKPVTVEVVDLPVDQFMARILRDQGLAFSVKDHSIIVSRKVESKQIRLKGADSALFLSPAVTGIVRSEDGQPLAGVSIMIKGTQTGTSSSANGSFSMEATAGNILVFTYIGYATLELKLGPAQVSGNKPLYITLKPADNKLDEMVVMAYGSTTRRFSVSNTGTIKAGDIANQPVTNALMALQGHVPGVAISASSGLANAGVKVSILGPSTFSSRNDPLIVIDGIPYTSNLMEGLGGILGNSGTEDRVGTSGSPLSFINPMDIERIDVLKDADATAIYGSRAANGALLITTKKGKVGKMTVDVSLRTGISLLNTKAKLLNTKQYLELRREGFSNYGLVPSSDPSSPDYAVDLMVWDTTRDIDLQKELLGKPVTYSNTQVSVSGGTNNVNYLISGTYNQDNSPIESVYGNNKDRKFSTHMALNTISNNKRFRTGVNFTYVYDINQLPAYDFTFDAFYLPPNVPEFFHADGSLNWAPDKSGISTFSNPFSKRYGVYKNNTSNLVTRFEMGYELTKGLTLSSSIGFNNLQSDDYMFLSSLYYQPEYRSFIPRQADKGIYNIRNLVLEPLLTYKGQLWKGKVEAIAGFNYQKENRSALKINGTGFVNDESLWDISQATSLRMSEQPTEYKYNAGFGKFSYVLLNKYILNLALRRDASSRFGPENRYHDFGSVGAGWIISEEDWFRKSFPFIGFAKLVTSYGSSGNDQIFDYLYMDLLMPGNENRPYQGIPSNRVSRLPNPYLQWEMTRKLNIGLDFTLLKNRINSNISYANYRSGNQLVDYYLPTTTGANSLMKNFPGVIRNAQWEISLNTVNINARDLKWTTSLNLTIPRNKLLKFDNLSESPYARNLIVGLPINILKVFRYAGLNKETGTYQFYDKDGKITNDPKPESDKIGVVKLDREFYGGLQNSVSYKNFTLDFFLYAQKQTILDPGTVGAAGIPGNFGNMTTAALNRWQKPGDDGIQKMASSLQNVETYGKVLESDFLYKNTFFVRLKNVNLSYTVPAAFVSRYHLSNARLFVQVQNLKVWTNYSGMDPENPGFAQNMPLRLTLVYGIQLSF